MSSSLEPTRKFADIIVLEGGHNLVALDMIMQRIANHIKESWTWASVRCAAAAVICLLGAVFFLLPLAAGILHFGMVWPAAVLLLAAAVLLWPAFFRRLLRPKMAARAGGLSGGGVFDGGAGDAGEDGPGRRPTVPWTARPAPWWCWAARCSRTATPVWCCEAAYRPPMTIRPDTRRRCAHSGGQNDSEPITEAACIRDTLTEMGIDPARIYLEDKSTSTEENLAFSAQVIAENGLPATAAIASDSFHQLRAAHMGRAQRSDALLELRQPLVSDGGLLGAGGGGAGVYGHHGEIVLKTVDLWEDG